MSNLPTYRGISYRRATDLPAEFWDALRQNEAAANIILPFAMKERNFPREDGNDQLWIILYDNASNNAIKDPYYDAKFTFCTWETLNKSPVPFPFPESEKICIALRPADMSHLEGIKIMCKDFSSTSLPYILDDRRAELEARKMVDNKQVWVHMIKDGDEEWEIASLVATTRESENVTAVTKVFTAEKWRGLKCAGRLLQRVCQEVLQDKHRVVVLYVGNSDDLKAARKVYHRVGFQGLDTQQVQKVENVERWIEIGFEGTTLGYW